VCVNEYVSVSVCEYVYRRVCEFDCVNVRILVSVRYGRPAGQLLCGI